MLTRYARERNFPNVSVYSDDGWSGTNFERPDWKRLIADIEASKVGIVLVKDYCEIMGLNQKDLENKAFWLSPFFF